MIKTEYLKKSLEELDPGSLSKAARILLNDGLVIAATDTVYGIVGKAFSQNVFSRINEMKSERKLPYVVVFQSVNRIKKHFKNLSGQQTKIIDALLPGPVTIVLSSNFQYGSEFGYDEFGVGVRVLPESAVSKLCHACNNPLWATSANPSGCNAPIEIEEISDEITTSADFIIDTGITIHKVASTVVDLRNSPYEILRAGPLAESIDKFIKRENEC